MDNGGVEHTTGGWGGAGRSEADYEGGADDREGGADDEGGWGRRRRIGADDRGLGWSMEG